VYLYLLSNTHNRRHLETRSATEPLSSEFGSDPEKTESTAGDHPAGDRLDRALVAM